MKSIDFKSFGLFTDITHEKRITGDVRREFADLVYLRTGGIAAHDLAFRIYRSNGPVELTDEEAAIVQDTARRFCNGAFIDGIDEQLAKNA